MAMEALRHPSELSQLGSSDYFKRRSKRPRSEDDGGEICLNEEDMELARSLMMLANGVMDKKDTKVEVSPPSTAVLTESTANVGGCYECGACGKVFGSYQALGGHKASHRKLVVSGEAAEAAVAVEVERVESGVRVHECAICHKQFPSGQALGGHKRRHYEGSLRKTNFHNKLDKLKLKAFNNNSEVTTATTFDGDVSSVVHQGIDLNIPALLEFWPAKRVMAAEEEVQSPLPAKKFYEHFHVRI